jgi:hypothetical protein
MSDDIKINVGVKSSVSQGMKSVSSDISGAMSGIKNALGTMLLSIFSEGAQQRQYRF